MSGDFDNKVLEIVERWFASRYTERHALVTSYDPDKHLAKVTFQPEGQESGWLPIETGHIGQGYGIAIGLQPGSGQGSQASGGGQTGDGAGGQGDASGGQDQNSGDQVIVRYQEGDIESGKIVLRVHSDQDKPPRVEAGEMVFWTKFKQDDSPGPDAAADGQSGSKGQKIFFKKDGSISVEDGNGATILFDGKGNIIHTCKDYTQKISGNHTVTIDGDKSVTISGKRNDKVTKNWGAKAKSGLWSWLTSGGDISD